MAQATLLDRTPYPGAVRSAAVSTTRFEVLDSWRGICALLVALFHFPATGFVSQSAFIGASYLFVDFFFVLSDFVITASYSNRLGNMTAAKRFALVRFGRVYPLHLLMLAAFVGFELLRLALPQLRGADASVISSKDLGSIVTNFLLLHGIGFEDRLTWNAPSWSISTEFFTYLLFASVLLLARQRAWVVFAITVIAAPPLLFAFSPSGMDVTWDFGFVRCLYGFSLGALLCWFLRDSIVSARSEITANASSGERIAWTLVELGTIVLIFFFVTSAGRGNLGIAAPYVFAIAIYVFSHDAGWISTLLRSRPLLMLGALSYSIYMVHMFIQGRMFNLASLIDRKVNLGLVGELEFQGQMAQGFGPESAVIGLAATVLMLVVTLAASYCSWRLVEMPALARFRNLSKKI